MEQNPVVPSAVISEIKYGSVALQVHRGSIRWWVDYWTANY